MEIKAGTAVKPSELELARQLEYIRMIREKNDAFEQANGRKKKFYSLAMGCQMNAHDSEKLEGMLFEMGFEPTDVEKEADFIIYNIPQLAGVELTVPLLNTMLENPKVIGVKNSSMPTQDIQKFKDAGRKNGRDFVVFNGPDEQFISGRIIGADGGIGGTYSVMPELFVKLNRLFVDGDWQTAQALQNDINSIIYVLASGMGGIYALNKAVLKKRTGLDMHGVRAPLFQLAQEDLPKVEQAYEMIEAAIKKYGA